MAFDTLPVTPGFGEDLAVKEDADGALHNRVLLEVLDAGEPVDVSIAKPIPVQVSNGTQTLPTMDAAARAGYVQITNGTIQLGVFAEDAAHSSAHTGLMALAVRQDTPGNLSGTDGDYEPLQVSAGRLWASATVTAVVPGTDATNLGKAEDAAHTSGDVGVMSLAVRKDTPANLSGTDADYEPIQVSGGRVWVSGQPAAIVTVAPAVDTNAYATGDLIGGKLTLANAARIAAGGGRIMSVTLVDQAKQSDAVDILFFEADPSGTTFTDNAAFDVADADLLNAVGHVSIAAADYCEFADNSVATVKNINLRFKLDSGTSLYAAIISRGSPTYVADSDVQIKVAIEQD